MEKSFKETLLKAKPKRRPKKLMAIRMPTDLEDELKSIAKKSKKSVSEVVVESLRHALDLPEGRK